MKTSNYMHRDLVRKALKELNDYAKQVKTLWGQFVQRDDAVRQDDGSLATAYVTTSLEGVHNTRFLGELMLEKVKDMLAAMDERIRAEERVPVKRGKRAVTRTGDLRPLRRRRSKPANTAKKTTKKVRGGGGALANGSQVAQA
jgi:hypothetical protein